MRLHHSWCRLQAEENLIKFFICLVNISIWNVWNITLYQLKTSLWFLFRHNEHFSRNFTWSCLRPTSRELKIKQSVGKHHKWYSLTCYPKPYHSSNLEASRIEIVETKEMWEDTCTSTSCLIQLRKELKLKDTQNRIKNCLDFRFKKFSRWNVTFLIKFAFTLATFLSPQTPM